MRYFLIIFGVCVLAVAGVLGKRGSHFRKPPLFIFPDTAEAVCNCWVSLFDDCVELL